MAIDYRDKIKKLLALAESPNENEAKAALLKARQLMVEHKLLETDCADIGKHSVQKRATGIRCTKRLNAWMMSLAGVIAENYCCVTWRTRSQGKQTAEICFAGFEDDLEICETVFKYAVDCIMVHNKELARTYGKLYSVRHIHKITDAYGHGFVSGIHTMYQKQTRENEKWGLVLVTPQEVQDEVSQMKKSTFKLPDEPVTIEEYQAKMEGERDGENFEPEKRLTHPVA